MSTLVTQTAHTTISADPLFVNAATGDCHRFYIHSLTTGELLQTVAFHSGPLVQGVNGVFMEDLLECVMMRLKGVQTGPFACAENAEALTHLQLALAALDRRTDRVRAEQTSN